MCTKDIWKILPIALWLFPFNTFANTAQSYVDLYGQAKTSEKVERAHQIFEKIKRSTNHHTSSTELVIINSDAKPWASALRDGNVILSKGALEVLYNNAHIDLAEARLAFVLGHELAHQFNGDHFHEDLLNFQLSGDKEFSDSLAHEQLESHRREQAADIHGFIYASVAGFRTDLILPGRTNAASDQSNDFLQYWVEQTGTQKGNSHPGAGKRTEFLSAVLATIDVNYFKYGTMLTHFGHFNLAEDFLNKFEKPFPSKVYMNSEVLNVLGYLNLQRARELTPPEQRYRFWLPTILDTNIKFPKTNIPKTRGLDKTTQLRQQAIDNAIDYFSSSTKMDSENVISKINLIIANILNESYGTARDLAKKALAKNSNNTMLLHLQAIANYADGVNIPDSNRQLEELAASEQADQYMIYNLAQVLTEQRYHIQATTNWQVLAKSLHTIPENYQIIVCAKIRNTCQAKKLDIETLNPNIEQLLPVRLGDHLSSDNVKKQLSGWHSNEPAALNDMEVQIFNRNRDSILSLNGTIQMIALSPENYGLHEIETLIDFVGLPLEKTPIPTGELWSYGPRWTAKVEGDYVREIWVSNAPGT